jgi:hypothetical protein
MAGRAGVKPRNYWPTEKATELLHPEGDMTGHNYHADEIRHADLEAKMRLLAAIEPIWMQCEGSGQDLLSPGSMWGTCGVCGHQMVMHDKGEARAWRHDRPDVMAMMKRGDFRRIWPHRETKSGD